MLAIRLHALGDVAITLPYLHAFHDACGAPALDLLTMAEYAELPRSLTLFRRVYALGGGRRFKRRLFSALTMVPRLAAERYDVVLDLQNEEISRTVRTLVRPTAWTTFDRESPLGAGERTRRAIEAAGFALPQMHAPVAVARADGALDILRDAGWTGSRELVVLSPAGAFPSRNWPMARYAAFARLWAEQRPAQFVVLGLPTLADKAAALERAIGPDLLNLVGKTTIGQAVAILQQARLVVAEDCGLMHLAWATGVPTLALFGSSRHDWSAPIGPHTMCLHSGDLPCGACMDAECRFGDVRCLTRYSAEFVVRQAESLLERSEMAPAGRALTVHRGHEGHSAPEASASGGGAPRESDH